MNYKETLTRECILKELKEAYSWKAVVVVLVIFVVTAALFAWIGSLLQWLFIYRVLFFCIIGGVIVGVLYVWITTYRIRQAINKQDVHVIVDKLVHTEDDCDRLLSWDRTGVYRYLVFASFGTYEIPKKTHYFWSDLYAMSDEGVYNTAIEGDTFYIVTDNKTILAVYNTKFFEYKDE